MKQPYSTYIRIYLELDSLHIMSYQEDTVSY